MLISLSTFVLGPPITATRVDSDFKFYECKAFLEALANHLRKAGISAEAYTNSTDGSLVVSTAGGLGGSATLEFTDGDSFVVKQHIDGRETTGLATCITPKVTVSWCSLNVNPNEAIVVASMRQELAIIANYLTCAYDSKYVPICKYQSYSD